mmetsp:Transcript_64/g.132  ORF Transcript_64/g.132 Transcript_64/m.132 type:complete len:254 (-) Transcript_64:92-853(-)
MVPDGHGSAHHDGGVVQVAKLRHHAAAAVCQAAGHGVDGEELAIWENFGDLVDIHMVLTWHPQLHVNDHVLSPAGYCLNDSWYAVELNRVAACAHSRGRSTFNFTVTVLVAAESCLNLRGQRGPRRSGGAPPQRHRSRLLHGKIHQVRAATESRIPPLRTGAVQTASGSGFRHPRQPCEHPGQRVPTRRSMTLSKLSWPCRWCCLSCSVAPPSSSPHGFRGPHATNLTRPKPAAPSSPAQRRGTRGAQWEALR